MKKPLTEEQVGRPRQAIAARDLHHTDRVEGGRDAGVYDQDLGPCMFGRFGEVTSKNSLTVQGQQYGFIVLRAQPI